MTDAKNINKPLFSQHYLDYRLQESPEWQLDIKLDFEKLKNLYLSKKAILPTLNEAQTEDVFIKPVLDILGFSNIPQVVTRGKGRAERPDYALFANEADRDTAYSFQNNETAFYGRVLVIAEAKYWERPLSKVSANDKRDIFKNENPSFQISSYLTGTGVYPNDLDELNCDEGVGKYLQEKKDILTSRAAYIRGNCEWFKYTWPLHKDKYHLPKIIVPYIAPENRFALDEKAEYISLKDKNIPDFCFHFVNK